MVIKNITYTDRLNKTRLFSLEQRRVKGDLIHIHKMSKNSELFKSMFKLNDYTSLKGNNLFTSKTRYRFNVKKNILLIKEQKKRKRKKKNG